MKQKLLNSLLGICLSSNLFAINFNYQYLYGEWTLNNLNGKSGVSFGKTMKTGRNASINLEFVNNGKYKIVYANNHKYYFKIHNGKLYISDKYNYLDNAIKYNKKYHVDILYLERQEDDCYILKYKQKKFIGYYNKSGYLFCKE